MKRVVILGNGTFPTTPIALSYLDRADITICCDGAAEGLIKYGKIPDYIVGDMDSLSLDLQREYAHLIIRSNCQESNDQTKAFRFAQQLSPTSIHFLGSTGAREDHSIGNISLLADYASSGFAIESSCNIEMVSDYGKFIAILGSKTISCRTKSQISIFSMDSSLKIKSAGLKYPTDSVIFDSWWKATLNETIHNSFSLEFSQPAKVIIFISAPKQQ